MNRERRIRLLTLGHLYLKAQRRNRVGKRRYWVHPVNRQRQTLGAWNTCLSEMRSSFPEKHRQAFRMDIECFNELLGHVQERIVKKDTFFRKAISAEQRLGVTLYYLATGDSFSTLALLFRLGTSTIREIVFETSKALWECLRSIYLATPSTPDEWKKISQEFERTWNFPHCLGAIDGKHCSIQCPPNSGSQYFNYKKFFSVVLLGVCDANYRFVYVDVGTSGRWSDGGTFDNCSLNEAVKGNTLNIPADIPLPGSDGNEGSPYTFIGDEAFPLKTWLMRPIPGQSAKEHNQKVYNYRLSRARRTIENTFGIMVARWRVLKRSLHMSTDHANDVILACCVLHNYMREKSPQMYAPPGFADSLDPNGDVVEGAWRAEHPLQPNNVRGCPRRPTQTATDVRDRLVRYFSGAGSLPWQDAYVRRTR